MFVVPLPTIFPRCGEEEVAGMTGKYAHNIDAKGRLFIPAKLREELGGKSFHLIIGQDMCLSLFSDESWNEKMAALKEQSYSSLKKLRMIFAHAADCDPDAQGRILIPADLRQKAGLEQGSDRGRQLRPRGNLERPALGQDGGGGLLLRRAAGGDGRNGAVSDGF